MISASEQIPSPGFIPFAKVEDFLSASRNNNPDLYPGERPTGSYLTNGHDLYAIKTELNEGGLQFLLQTGKGEAEVDDYLHQQGVANIEDRIPVLAFGANMCPGSLASKFQKDIEKVEEHGEVSVHNHRPDLGIVPTVYGVLASHDVVWSGGPGVNGNFTAILYKGEETAQTNIQVGINFLTREQLLMMHATELNYNLSTIGVNVAGKEIQTYYYAGTDSVYVENGKPVAVRAIPAEDRVLPEDDAAPVLNRLLSTAAIMSELYGDYPELAETQDSQAYIAYTRSLPTSRGKEARLTIRKQMHAAVAKGGYSRVVENTNTVTANWANPSRLTTYGEQVRGVEASGVYVLPSSEMPRGSWYNDKARLHVLRGLSAHLVRTSGGELTFKKPEPTKPEVV